MMPIFALVMLGCGFVLLLAARRSRALCLSRLGTLLGRDAPKSQAVPALEMLLPGHLLRDLGKFGWEPRPRDLAPAAGGLVLLALLAAFLLGPLAAAGLCALLLLSGWAALNILASHRAGQLAATLPAFFDRVRQLLAVGNSLPVAFARAAQASPPLLAKFLAPTLRRIANGANVSDSIRQCADVTGLHEMHLFAAAVATHARFGGSLGVALASLIGFLRKRAAIARELRSNTAQIRASAWVLALLPILVAALILAQNPDYGAWFTGNAQGRRLALYCLVSQAIGALLMKRIARLDF